MRGFGHRLVAITAVLMACLSVLGTASAQAQERACSCSPRPPRSGTGRSRRASRRSRNSAPPTTSPSTPPRTRRRSRPRTSRATPRSCGCRPRATCSTRRSRPRSRPTSRPAAATPACTPPATPSTRGTGTAAWSARTSAATRRTRRRRSRSSTTCTRRPSTCRRAGRASTSGTASNPTRAARSTCSRRLDETTYAPGGSAMGTDHPIAWCHYYQGGRAWYTGMGHTDESYSDPAFREHLLGGILWAAGAVANDCGGTVWSNFQKTVLDDNVASPMGLDVAPDGRTIYIERAGQVRVIDPVDRARPRPRSTSRCSTASRTACSASRSIRSSPPTAGSTCSTRRPAPRSRRRASTSRASR